MRTAQQRTVLHGLRPPETGVTKPQCRRRRYFEGSEFRHQHDAYCSARRVKAIDSCRGVCLGSMLVQVIRLFPTQAAPDRGAA
eukprot:10613319-Alexandrium_andersonii.AAC.3